MLQAEFTVSTLHTIQGDPNQNLSFQMAVTLKLFISDPMSVKPKCVSGTESFSNFQMFIHIFQLFVYIF